MKKSLGELMTQREELLFVIKEKKKLKKATRFERRLLERLNDKIKMAQIQELTIMRFDEFQKMCV
jgi:hypothetical protein